MNGMLRRFASCSRSSLHRGSGTPWAIVLAATLFLASCSSTAPSQDNDQTSAWTGAGELLLAPPLATAIRHSRDEAVERGTRPLPPALQRALKPHFDSEALQEARWAMVSDDWTADTLIARTRSRYAAMTLDNVIVFFNEASTRDVKVWIHELLHVEQYRSQGVDLFAQQYIAEWTKIETETRNEADRIHSKLGPTAATLFAQEHPPPGIIE